MSAPRKEHTQALSWLVRYLKGTGYKVTLLRPKIGKSLEVYVDADFARNFDKDDLLDRDTKRSRHGYIIMYNGLPLVWKYQLQTQITLSRTDPEYTGL